VPGVLRARAVSWRGWFACTPGSRLKKTFARQGNSTSTKSNIGWLPVSKRTATWSWHAQSRGGRRLLVWQTKPELLSSIEHHYSPFPPRVRVVVECCQAARARNEAQGDGVGGTNEGRARGVEERIPSPLMRVVTCWARGRDSNTPFTRRFAAARRWGPRIRWSRPTYGIGQRLVSRGLGVFGCGGMDTPEAATGATGAVCCGVGAGRRLAGLEKKGVRVESLLARSMFGVMPEKPRPSR